MSGFWWDSDIWTTNVSSMLPKDEYNLYGCWPCRHSQLSRTVVAPQKLEDCKQYESFRLIYWTHGRKHDGFTVTVLVAYIGMRLVSTLLIKDPLGWGVLVPILRPYKYQYTSHLVGTWGNTRHLYQHKKNQFQYQVYSSVIPAQKWVLDPVIRTRLACKFSKGPNTGTLNPTPSWYEFIFLNSRYQDQAEMFKSQYEKNIGLYTIPSRLPMSHDLLLQYWGMQTDKGDSNKTSNCKILVLEDVVSLEKQQNKTLFWSPQ